MAGPRPDARIGQALGLLRDGQAGLAQAVARQVLAERPGDAHALMLLAMVEGQRGDAAAALALLRQAQASAPLEPEVHFRLGLAHQQLGQDAQALEAFDATLRLAPGTPAALNARGLALKALGRLDDALAAYREAVARAPGFAEAWNNKGVAERALGRLDDSLASLREAARALPASPEIQNNIGWTLHLLGRHAEALAHYAQALQRRPRDAEILSNQAATLHGLGRFDDAAAAYELALAQAPDAWQTLMNLGATRTEQGRAEDALALYARAEAIAPGEVDIALNRGNALAELGRHAEALAQYEAVARARPADAGARMNIANTLRDMQRHAEALPHYEQALALAAGDAERADVHFNRGLCLLALGAYARGWADNEWRWKARRLGQVEPVFAQPKWLGREPLEGRTLLLHAEQGLGDTLQMCRYARVAAAQGARVLLQAQKPIVALLRETLGDCCEVVAEGEPLPPFDLHCPLMSAPLAFGTTLETVPAEAPYLRVPQERVAHWRGVLGAGMHVGLAWAGNPNYAADRRRSIPLQQLLAALPPGPRYWCLQKDVPPRDQPAFDAAGIGRFEQDRFPDTAAQAQCMDLVIAVDTSIAHLAGAVGAPLWLLLAHAADFRWLAHRTDSPWYPSARLWRQPAPGDWSPLLATLRQALQSRIAGR